MKTKIVALSLMCMIFGLAGANAQNYYTSDTIRGDGFTYKRDLVGGLRIDLSNINNRYADIEWTYKDGSPTGIANLEEVGQFLESFDLPRLKVTEIVDNALTAAEKSSLRAYKPRYDFMHELVVIGIFDSDTGKVIELFFRFWAASPFVKVPPSTYYKIERQIKRELRVVPTKIAKQYNYLRLGWTYKVE